MNEKEVMPMAQEDDLAGCGCCQTCGCEDTPEDGGDCGCCSCACGCCD